MFSHEMGICVHGIYHLTSHSTARQLLHDIDVSTRCSDEENAQVRTTKWQLCGPDLHK
jgi:hypothetical protein